MYKRFSQLSFVIGLFFAIVSVILLATALQHREGTHLNMYTAVVFLLFGLAMMFIKSEKTSGS